jgi:hypothetical protein
MFLTSLRHLAISARSSPYESCASDDFERIKAMVTFRSRVVSSALRLFAASTFYALALPESTEQRLTCMQL